MRIVVDTNVVVAALRSQTGASHELLVHIHLRRVTPLLSVPLLMEYEEVLKRPGLIPHLTPADIDTMLDQFASRAVATRIHFLWRPFLPDPDDDMLVELALAGQASHIVTSNIRDLALARTLGLEVVTPAEFIRQLSPP